MAILQSQDLFVVYQPEVGSPQALTVDGIDATLVSNNTGELYDVTTNRLNLTLSADDVESSYTSSGTGLRMSVRLLEGQPVDFYLSASGINYIVGEVLELVGGTSKFVVTEVGPAGEVRNGYFYDSGDVYNYTITNGLLTNFPFGTVADMENYEPSQTGLFVDLAVEDGVVKAANRGTQIFNTNYVHEPATMTVGDQVRILVNRDSSGEHVDVFVKMVGSAISGGISKFDVGQLKSEVQEWASENDVNLDVEVLDNDGTVGGDLAYNSSTGKLTYTKSAATIGSDEASVTLNGSHGYVLDEYNAWDPETSDEITTQQQLNENLMKRIELLEATLYANTGLNQINADSPRVAINTEAKDKDGNTYSPIATRNDVSFTEAASAQARMALEAANDLYDAAVNSTNFDEFKAAVAASEDPIDPPDSVEDDDQVPDPPTPQDPNDPQPPAPSYD